MSDDEPEPEPCPQCKDFKDKRILHDGHDERCIYSVRAQFLIHDREKDD